jgi:hypothetical protein
MTAAVEMARSPNVDVYSIRTLVVIVRGPLYLRHVPGYSMEQGRIVVTDLLVAMERASRIEEIEICLHGGTERKQGACVEMVSMHVTTTTCRTAKSRREGGRCRDKVCTGQPQCIEYPPLVM